MHKRRVLADGITYVGLDVHKEWLVVAIAEGGGRGEVREYRRIANTTEALERLVRKLGQKGAEPRFGYKAGPCGYGIQRQLSASGHDCVVVAPSLIPKRAGDRVKTDRRDAASLARLHRAGELTAVWVPDAGHAGGAVAVWGTLATTICRVADPMQVARPRQLRDASTVMRFRPAHQSMINRRHDNCASCSARHSLKHALEIKPRIHAPATCKGGHESGQIIRLVPGSEGGSRP